MDLKHSNYYRLIVYQAMSRDRVGAVATIMYINMGISWIVDSWETFEYRACNNISAVCKG